MTASPEALACPSCTHPWTAHGRDGCAYAEPGAGCWCANTGATSRPGQMVLGGFDAGRRLETVQYGVQHPRTPLSTAGVELAADESHARAVADDWPFTDARVVRRSIITYTGQWEPL